MMICGIFVFVFVFGSFSISAFHIADFQQLFFSPKRMLRVAPHQKWMAAQHEPSKRSQNFDFVAKSNPPSLFNFVSYHISFFNLIDNFL
jgi:hypothetical protein